MPVRWKGKMGTFLMFLFLATNATDTINRGSGQDPVTENLSSGLLIRGSQIRPLMGSPAQTLPN
jgi:hypothetical protein